MNKTEKIIEFKIQQTVVRTRPTAKGYNYDPRSFEILRNHLIEGWTVVMCTPIGEELEYILQKRIHEGGKSHVNGQKM